MAVGREFRELTVAEVTPLCEDAVAVGFLVPPQYAYEFAFRAGQFLTLRRTVDGVEERRSFSICAPEGSPPRIGVREVPSGALSPWLVREVRVGDRIEVQPPSGNFTPGSDPAGHHVFIVAGSGITPALSIASTILRRGATVTIFYGNRRASTVMFADDLADLKDLHPDRVELVHVLSREQRESDLFTGRLDADRLRELIPLLTAPDEVAHWWLCGPYGMVNDARQALADHHVDPHRVHVELFYVEEVEPPLERHAERPPTGAISEVTVMLDGRSTTMTLDRETSILDGAQSLRPDLPFACKGGVCGTCRAKLVEGEVVMRRNFALEEWEVQDGFVLTCQSRPVTDVVRVEFDA